MLQQTARENAGDVPSFVCLLKCVHEETITESTIPSIPEPAVKYWLVRLHSILCYDSFQQEVLPFPNLATVEELLPLQMGHT